MLLLLLLLLEEEEEEKEKKRKEAAVAITTTIKTPSFQNATQHPALFEARISPTACHLLCHHLYRDPLEACAAHRPHLQPDVETPCTSQKHVGGCAKERAEARHLPITTPAS
jgi:hypothetical protein